MQYFKKINLINFKKLKSLKLFGAYEMKDLESEEKIAIDIAKLERNLKQVEDIKFEGKEKEVYDRAIDYWNDSKYYLEKKDTRTAFGCIEYSHGLLDALRMIHGLI